MKNELFKNDDDKCFDFFQKIILIGKIMQS